MAPASSLVTALLAVLMVVMAAGNPAPVLSRWYSLASSKAEADTIEARLLFQPLDTQFEQSWTNFKQTYAKQYETDAEEKRRMEIFRSNLDTIDAHNALYARGLKSYTMGVNQFTDLELDEFVAMMNGFKAINTSHHGATYRSPANEFATLTLADEVDWRGKGYVTPVKDQGQCGSCWAFSSTGSMEGQHFASSGELVSLSEQQLVDCSKTYGNMGCQGGQMDRAFKYVIDNGGIDTEESYPYTATDTGPCMYSPSGVGATFSSYVDLSPGDESALKEAVATVGPVSVAIDANHESFQHYSGGLYNETACSSVDLDHAVLVVGYGQTDGQDSWIVKNSWTTSWGDAGYIYMSRNKDNQCGIATTASYPVV